MENKMAKVRKSRDVNVTIRDFFDYYFSFYLQKFIVSLTGYNITGSQLSIFVLSPFTAIPAQIIKILFGMSKVEYVENSKFGLNNIIKYYLQIDMFQLFSLSLLLFLASIALVSVILPNLYFRVMLYTDDITNGHKNVASDILNGLTDIIVANLKLDTDDGDDRKYDIVNPYKDMNSGYKENDVLPLVKEKQYYRWSLPNLAKTNDRNHQNAKVKDSVLENQSINVIKWVPHHQERWHPVTSRPDVNGETQVIKSFNTYGKIVAIKKAKKKQHPLFYVK